MMLTAARASRNLSNACSADRDRLRGVASDRAEFFGFI